MKQLLLISALSAGFLAFSAVPSQARNYDCSKPGNATKVACKSASKTPPAKPSPSKAVSAKVASNTTTKTTTQRNYDCSKAGNKNKAACKTSVAARPAPAIARAAAPRQAPSTTKVVANGPKGATAACKDGTYSQAKEHRGACSRHGGVAKWFS